MRFFLTAAQFFRRASLDHLSARPIRCYNATMLRSHPADATQIQRVAVPTPNNGILLKRFFTAVAVVKEFYTKGNQSSELFAVSSTPRSLPAYIKKTPQQ